MLEALLTYTDSDGLLRLHLLRGVELLPRPQGGRLALKERSPAEPTAEDGGRLALFEAWLAEEVAESVSPEGSAGAGRARATRGELIVELLADKVAKAGWQAASGGPGQQRAAVARRERFEARVTCARRRGERAARERAALVALERTCEDLHARSHGESFLQFFQALFVAGGLYLIDEPEAALSPQRQLAFLSLLKRMVETEGSQFIIATHSPLLLAYPGARILQFDGAGVRATAYEQLEHVTLVRSFLANPERFLRKL